MYRLNTRDKRYAWLDETYSIGDYDIMFELNRFKFAINFTIYCGKLFPDLKPILRIISYVNLLQTKVTLLL